MTGLGAAPLRIVFDAESLLLDPEPAVRAALTAMVRAFGGQGLSRLPADWTPRASLYNTLVTLLGTEDGRVIERAHASYHQHFSGPGPARFSLRSGAAEILALMKEAAGCEWHYLSTLGPEQSRRMLADHRLGDVVTSMFTGAHPACPGMRPRLLQALHESLHCDAATMLVLGDLPQELNAARLLGMQTVALNYGRCPRDLLDLAPADHRVDTVRDMAHWLRRCLFRNSPAELHSRSGQLMAASARVH